MEKSISSEDSVSSTAAPTGLIPVYHPSGTIRIDNQVDGVASGYSPALYTGTPVKRTTDGTLVAVGTGADVCIGVFQGCQFTASTKRFVLPYFPASQTYDAGSMIAYFTSDPQIVYEGQANATIAATTIGEGINLANTSQGSTYTGFSTQALDASTTGSTDATFQVLGLAPYPNNAWGDAYPVLRVKISTYQGQVA